MQTVQDYAAPLVEILRGTTTMLRGNFGVLRKIAREQFDEDFIIVPQGGEVPKGAFLKNKPE